MLLAGGAGWDGELIRAPPDVPTLAKPTPGCPSYWWGGGPGKVNSSSPGMDPGA